jgi:hypothetical protein
VQRKRPLPGSLRATRKAVACAGQQIEKAGDSIERATKRDKK